MIFSFIDPPRAVEDLTSGQNTGYGVQQVTCGQQNNGFLITQVIFHGTYQKYILLNYVNRLGRNIGCLFLLFLFSFILYNFIYAYFSLFFTDFDRKQEFLYSLVVCLLIKQEI